MAAALSQLEKQGRLKLSGELDFVSVASLRGALAPHLKKGNALSIDLAAVERTNSAALALLLHWLEEALDRGCRITFTNLPEKLVDLAELHGVKGLLPIA